MARADWHRYCHAHAQRRADAIQQAGREAGLGAPDAAARVQATDRAAKAAALAFDEREPLLGLEAWTAIRPEEAS